MDSIDETPHQTADETSMDSEVSKFKQVNQNIQKQCSKLDDLMQSFDTPNSVDTIKTEPKPTMSHVLPGNNPAKPLPLVEIDLDFAISNMEYKIQRSLWLRNLLQLKESFGSQMIFYNGKITWEKEKEKEVEVEKAVSVSDVVSPESPEKAMKDSPVTIGSESENSHINSDEKILEKATEESSPSTSHNTDIKLSNIKQSHKEAKVTDSESNTTYDRQMLRSVRRNIDTSGLTIKLDAKDSTESSTNTTLKGDSTESKMAKKDSCESKHKKSISMPEKRKVASDFFDDDHDSSFSNSDLDNSFSLERECRRTPMDRVNTGVKRMKIEEGGYSDSECCGAESRLTSQEEEEINFQMLMMNMVDMDEVLNYGKCPISKRKCKVCGIVERNMKRHAIFDHITNVWWGVIGDATCWHCQSYHTIQEIRNCDGFYVPQRDLRCLMVRHTEFFSYMKDDLECSSDEDLLEIITREGLCNNSTSPFTTSEINFMRAIDRAKGLSTNHLYSAQYPIRLTEILHWKTLSELMNYCNMRGVISSDTISMKPLRFIDGDCNINKLYSMYNYQGPLDQFPNLRMAPSSAFLYKVVTDITEPSVYFSPWTRRILMDGDIKLSLGLLPCLANYCSSIYLREVEQAISNPSIVAIGPVGIDSRMTNTMEIQRSVFTSFLKIAERTTITLRIACTGAHCLCLHLMKTHLPKTQLIHYLNFVGTLEEAENFLAEFPNGYIGISKMSCQSQNAQSIVKRVPTTRLVPGSNSPFTINMAKPPLPTDVGDIIIMVSKIKGLPIQSIAKDFRVNARNLYGM